MLRIRNNGTLTPLKISPETLQYLQDFVSSNRHMEVSKRTMIRKLTNGSPCCACGGIPSVQVNYPIEGGGATLVERYCDKCIKKVYEREPVL